MKRLESLADAFKIFCETNDDVDLVVGGPDGGTQPDFENAIAAYGLQSRVRLVAPLHGRDKFAAHADSGLVVPHDAADIAAILSVFDGRPGTTRYVGRQWTCLLRGQADPGGGRPHHDRELPHA